MFAIGGLAYFVVGTTHWGLFYLFGFVVTACVPFAVEFPYAAPLLYGLTMAGAMLYWAYAVKVKFGGQSQLDEDLPPRTPNLLTLPYHPNSHPPLPSKVLR